MLDDLSSLSAARPYDPIEPVLKGSRHHFERENTDTKVLVVGTPAEQVAARERRLVSEIYRLGHITREEHVEVMDRLIKKQKEVGLA